MLFLDHIIILFVFYPIKAGISDANNSSKNT